MLPPARNRRGAAAGWCIACSHPGHARCHSAACDTVAGGLARCSSTRRHRPRARGAHPCCCPQAYTQQLPEGVSQHDLLRMAAVADAFELRDGAAACLAHLAELPTDELLWVTVTAALTLPSGLAALPAAKKLVKRATRRLRHVLGDLEETLQRSRGVLEALPLPALLALLRHSKTSVASEGTAVAAVALWVAAQQRAGASVSGEQLRQLAGCIRMMQLPFTYLGTVLPRIGWLAGIITPAHIAALTTAKGVAAADGSMDEFKADVLSGSDSDSGLWSAWLAKARPASERTRVAVQLAAHKDLILSGKELPLSSEGVEAWGGYWWGLRLLTQMDASFQLQVALEAIGSVGGGAGPPAQQQLLLEPAAFVHASLDCLTGGGKDKITASYTCLLVDNASLDAFNLIAHRDPSFGLLPGELTPFLHNDRLRLRLTVRELH